MARAAWLARDNDADLVMVCAAHEVSLAERLLGTTASEVLRRPPARSWWSVPGRTTHRRLGFRVPVPHRGKRP